jgi:hypothetical protein
VDTTSRGPSQSPVPALNEEKARTWNGQAGSLGGRGIPALPGMGQLPGSGASTPKPAYRRTRGSAASTGGGNAHDCHSTNSGFGGNDFIQYLMFEEVRASDARRGDGGGKAQSQRLLGSSVIMFLQHAQHQRTTDPSSVPILLGCLEAMGETLATIVEQVSRLFHLFAN